MRARSCVANGRACERGSIMCVTHTLARVIDLTSTNHSLVHAVYASVAQDADAQIRPCFPAKSRACNADEVEAALRLLLVPGIGSARLRRLREAFGSARAAFKAPLDSFAQALRCSIEEAADVLGHALRADVSRELAACADANARIIALCDEDYPNLLSATGDPPELLIVRGALDATPEMAVAIVGSRRASVYGCMQATRLATDLAQRGVTIVSGGARGIDAQAHRGAMRAGGRTIAVLATGLHHPYPREHAELFDAIVQSGGATITEQPSFVTPRADLFPRRNRIVAALSLAVVVVEAATRSGALLTARLAVDDLSRDAGCLPGSVDSPTSAGCHRAIREGWARLITNADDVCEMLADARMLVRGAAESAVQRAQEGAAKPRHSSRSPSRSSSQAQRSTPPTRIEPIVASSPDATEVLAVIVRLQGAGLDELERELEWSVSRLASATMELEVQGRISRRRDGAFLARGAGEGGSRG